MDLGKEVKKDRYREVPPYTGFGTEEDSLTSCQGLEPRPPERDFYKFMHKDRCEFKNNIFEMSNKITSNSVSLSSFPIVFEWW